MRVCVCVCENHLLFFHRIFSQCISLSISRLLCWFNNNNFSSTKILSFLFVLYIRWLYIIIIIIIIIIHGYLTWILKFLSISLSWLKENNKKNNKKPKIKYWNKKQHTHTHDVQSKENTHEMDNIQTPNFCVVCVCVDHRALFYRLSILHQTLRSCRNCCSHTHSRCCWNITQTLTRMTFYSSLFFFFVFFVLQTINCRLQRRHPTPKTSLIFTSLFV